MTDPAPVPERRRLPVFAIVATFVGTLCAVAVGAAVMFGYGSERLATLGGPAPACHAPGRLATAAEARRFHDCEQAELVREQLIASGAEAANVSVTSLESRKLIGPDEVQVVHVQVFGDEWLLREWRASDMPRTIALMLGTEVRHVTIVDDRLETLFDGSTWVQGRATDPPSSSPALQHRGSDRPLRSAR